MMATAVNKLPIGKSDSSRSFYDLLEAYKRCIQPSLKKNGLKDVPVKHKVQLPPNLESFYELDHGSELSAFIDGNIVGNDLKISTPFGNKRQVYCDYTASGKALRCIEDYILHKVLPSYANTHTTTSATSLQTTIFREEAREIIRNSVGASEDDAVIFVGSGCTGAIHKLIHCLNLREPPIVLVGASEHHSNLLPWREIAAQVIRIKQSSDGVLDLSQLEEDLKSVSSTNSCNRQLIGCFSAASNITGTLNPDLAITALLHRYGALAFFDYATAAPYVSIKMNPMTTEYPSGIAFKDAIYFSMHKFVGGVQTPGVLIVKKSLLRNQVPHEAGGGTVLFVDRDNHRYLSDQEMREEGGTSAIVESIRAGLVFKLKDSISAEWIMQREETLVQRAYSKWLNVPEIVLLGSTYAPRLSIFSFLIRHPTTGYFLHHKFVCALLNDLYGIQSRGGCACAGPYAIDLLGIDDVTTLRYENLVLEEDSHFDRTHLKKREEHSCFDIIKPGFTRLNLPYFASDAEIDFVLRAVVAVAKRGWTLLPQYQINREIGEYRHQSHITSRDHNSLNFVDFQSGKMQVRNPNLNLNVIKVDLSYEDCLKKAELIFDQAVHGKNLFGRRLSEQRDSCSIEAEDLRWFLLPSEAQEIIRGSVPSLAKDPFTPRQYLPIKSATFQLHHYSTISSMNKIKNASETIATVAGDLDRGHKVNGIIKSQHHNSGKIVDGYISESMNLKYFTTTIIVNINDSGKTIEKDAYNNRKELDDGIKNTSRRTKSYVSLLTVDLQNDYQIVIDGKQKSYIPK